MLPACRVFDQARSHDLNAPASSVISSQDRQSCIAALDKLCYDATMQRRLVRNQFRDGMKAGLAPEHITGM